MKLFGATVTPVHGSQCMGMFFAVKKNASVMHLCFYRRGNLLLEKIEFNLVLVRTSRNMGLLAAVKELKQFLR